MTAAALCSLTTIMRMSWLRNSIVSGNSGPTDSGDMGVLAGVDASHVRVFSSIAGGQLFDNAGGAVGGWSFSASTMLGELGFHAGGVTRTYPLMESADNPAIGQGLTVDELRLSPLHVPRLSMKQSLPQIKTVRRAAVVRSEPLQHNET